MTQNTIFNSSSLPTKTDGYKRYWQHLHGCADSLAIAEAAGNYHGVLAVIVDDNVDAERLEKQLYFFNPNLTILCLPDWETLPYDRVSPAEEIISQRIGVLTQLNTLKQAVLILPLNVMIQTLADINFITGHSLRLKIGDHLDLEQLRQNLQKKGYQAVSQVMQHSEFALRGAIIDIFPMGSELPYRIDLFDNEIDTIRHFDIDSQRSGEKMNEITLLPGKEYPLTKDSIAQFRQKWCEQFSGNPKRCPIYEDVSQGQAPAGIEYYLPLFFQQSATLFDYLPSQTSFIYHNNFSDKLSQCRQQIDKRYEQLAHDITRPILPPNSLFLSENDLFRQLNGFPQVVIDGDGTINKTDVINFTTKNVPTLAVNHKLAQPLQALLDFMSKSTKTLLFCAESAGRREALKELLQTAGITIKSVTSWQDFLNHCLPIKQHAITIAQLEHGLSGDQLNFEIITEAQLYSDHVAQAGKQRQQKSNINQQAIIRHLAELNIGDPVVHIEHGIGRYMGLETIHVDNHMDEYLTLSYADDNKLYVPISALNLISRYTGADSNTISLHRLGNDKWQKEKQKAFKKIYDVAAELLEIYAARAIQQTEKCSLPDQDYQNFCQTFPFEETPDQAQAIQDIINDICSTKPMDRLICGDVGFGKTEVAMRAAFITALNHKQVAILVPTTLLAQQHYQNFKDRFADWPVTIDILSRFRDSKAQKQILQRLARGGIDIIIGTHRLLQSDIRFKTLGLIIIDEEHRFGVRHKEKLKSLRNNVNILTLTATPIPRTLNMSLSGIRDLSLIATPPARRLGIKTFVREYSTVVIREAISREMMRGGQVYYLHNNVRTIDKTALDLQKLIPEARIAIGHGQMREKTLEKIMSDFYHQHYNILLCTTIIESGIDIPTANTIIIDRADKFGLAQLHQLRGRVGRSNHQAYAYLLTPPIKTMTTDARKRLDAIATLGDLGIGFTLATHDLEIRGTGELLGDEQSGHIESLGFSLYMDMLERAINDLRTGNKPNFNKAFSQEAIEINLPMNTLIPVDYLPDPHLRLTCYKRLSDCTDKKSLTAFKIEMIDRFGLLPPETENLFMVNALKQRAIALGIEKINTSQHYITIVFADNSNVNRQNIVTLIQQQKCQFSSANQIRFPYDNSENVITAIDQIIDRLH
ncbi:MAG: transcription-repair coupling factor [Pseudomonadota bacterium]